MASSPLKAANNNNPNFIPTRVLDAEGNPFYKSLGAPGLKANNLGGTGGGGVKTTLTDLRQNVALLNGLAAIFATALAGLFIFFLNRIDDRFDKANEKIEHVSDQVSDVRVSVAGQSVDIKSILEKVDAQKPAPSPRSKSGQ